LQSHLSITSKISGRMFVRCVCSEYRRLEACWRARRVSVASSNELIFAHHTHASQYFVFTLASAEEPPKFNFLPNELVGPLAIATDNRVVVLSDLSFYLQQTGYSEEAIRVLSKVLEFSPIRLVSQLNLRTSSYKTWARHQSDHGTRSTRADGG
jgi:hypothetical protein